MQTDFSKLVLDLTSIFSRATVHGLETRSCSMITAQFLIKNWNRDDFYWLFVPFSLKLPSFGEKTGFLRLIDRTFICLKNQDFRRCGTCFGDMTFEDSFQCFRVTFWMTYPSYFNLWSLNEFLGPMLTKSTVLIWSLFQHLCISL